jgi:glutamate synthase (NADPH/NADH) small chain
MACAQRLNRAGHSVTVFERDPAIGGMLRYVIPEYRLPKHLIDRRVEFLTCEGVQWVTSVNVGTQSDINELRSTFDAIILCCGAEKPRDIPIPGRELCGIYFAVDYLRMIHAVAETSLNSLTTANKRVLVLSEHVDGWIGAVVRERPLSIHVFGINPKLPETRLPGSPQLHWPLHRSVPTPHEGEWVQEWSIATTKFEGDQGGNVRKVHAVRVGPPPRYDLQAGTEFTIDVDIVLLSLGFLGPVHLGLIDNLGLQLDNRGNIATDVNYMSSMPGVFSAGDARRGQSQVVWAIREGRRAARGCDEYLMGTSASLRDF